MANYECTTRTNYFRVTDEEQYKKLFSHLAGEAGVEDFTHADYHGVIWHGFGAYSSIYMCDDDAEDEDDNYTIDAFVRELQKILPAGEAFIMMETGSEKLRYVTGWAIVATSNDVKCINLRDECLKAACKMLGDPDFTTLMEY